MRFFIFLLFLIVTMMIYAQDKSYIERVERLEARMMALEDFVKQRLDSLATKNMSGDISQQKELQQLITDMQRNIKDMQAEILRLRITINTIQRGENVVEKNPPSPEKVPNVADDVSAFQNTDVGKYAKQLQAPESSIRINAIIMLSRMEKEEESTKALLLGFKDKDAYVRSLTAKALGKRSAKIAIVPLLELMLDSDADVRAVGAKALQDITKSKDIFPYQSSLEERQKAITEWQKKYQQLRD